MSATLPLVSKIQSVITDGQLATPPLTSALKNQSVTSSPDGQPIASLSTAGHFRPEFYNVTDTTKKG